MDGEDIRQLEIFTAALEVAAGERATFVKKACGGDDNLRQKIAALLDAHERTGGFLEKSPMEDTVLKAQAAHIGEKIGDQIGKYKLLQQIGEGGCGVVFLAEQLEPVKRQVALKVLKPGMDTKSVITRFEVERQALALMDHPNIAKVFDAGATVSGRPYFVMELIRGVKITHYCDLNLLNVRERLKLFIQVCHAIQHAHQKGIIHRDIKPSNILVTTTEDGVAVPVVIDFGIAKATTDHQLTDKSLHTAIEMLIGTPAYMSPEQAALTNIDVDTRTDIYSLGAVLYELLTGSTPFDTKVSMKEGIDEIRRVIREEEPVRPSARLSQTPTSDLQSVARNRKSETQKLIRDVRGDLDWITIKALEKDRTRRYATAYGLASDVHRYLADEAVTARPPSALYRLRKTARRNKLLFLSIGAVSAILMVSLVLVSAGFARERQARRKAVTETAKSRQITQFLEDMLKGVGPSVARGRDTTMLMEILTNTAARVGPELTNQPAVEAELRGVMGQLYQALGNYDQAQAMERKALEINRKLYGAKSLIAAVSLNDLSIAYMSDSKLAEAQAAGEESLNIQQRLSSNQDAELAATLDNLGQVYRQQGKDAAAEKFAREALEIRRRLFGNGSLEAAASMQNLSFILTNERKWDEAETMAREVLAIRTERLGPDDPSVATAMTDIAWIEGVEGKVAEAESFEQKAVAIRLKILPSDHPDVAKSLYLIGDRVRQRGDKFDADTLLSVALSIQRKLLGPDNPSTLDTMRSLGSAFLAEGKLSEAEALHKEAMAVWRARGESETPRALGELEFLVHVYIAEKKFSEAEQALDEALTPAVLTQRACVNPLLLRVELYARRNQWKEAAAAASLAFERDPLDSNHYGELAALLIKTHDLPAYETLCHRILATSAGNNDIYAADNVAKACLFRPCRKIDLAEVAREADLTVTAGAGDPNAMPFFQICKALSEYRQGHFAEAADWARRAADGARADARPHAYAVLAMADWRLGKTSEAREMLAKGNELTPTSMPAHLSDTLADTWLVWLFARIQLDEAESLIQPTAAAGNALAQ